MTVTKTGRSEIIFINYSNSQLKYNTFTFLQLRPFPHVNWTLSPLQSTNTL